MPANPKHCAIGLLRGGHPTLLHEPAKREREQMGALLLWQFKTGSASCKKSSPLSHSSSGWLPRRVPPMPRAA